MIYLVVFLVGIINALFAAGSGQILVFYLIYISKLETHKVRALSVAILSISSVFSIFGYKNIIDIEFNPVTFVDTRAEIAQNFMIGLYVIYAIIMFVFSMISIKKKKAA